MQIKLRRTSSARPSDRSSAGTQLIANIFQGTNVVRRRRDNPFKAPRTIRQSPTLTASGPSDPRQRSSRQSIHIGHALGSGFVQSIFSPPPRRLPFECFPSVSRRDADLKILCIMGNDEVWWKADLWLLVTPTKRRADRVQPPFCATSVQAILKNLHWEIL
jgi:hypothetical protein